MTTVVMTGATSGIGRVAAEHMLQTPDVQLWLGARGAPPAGAHVLPLDLARLASVRAFAQAVGERLGETPIFAPPPGRLYASLVKRQLTWPETSDLAKRDDEMNKLWRDSAAMVGLPDDPLPGPHS